MKAYKNFKTTLMIAAVLGLFGATLGVKRVESAELNMFLGKLDSSTVVYFVSDWFCPACRRTEPAIAKMYPKISAIAKVSFVDMRVYSGTTNFTPYNTQFLMHEKGKYINLRGALSELSKNTKRPSPEDVQKAIVPFGVKLRSMNYADIESGIDWNEKINSTYNIKVTPTVIVANEKTGKHIKLVGEKEISYEAIVKAIAATQK